MKIKTILSRKWYTFFSMELNPQSLEKLQNIFKKMPQILAVYLYGSRVKGYATKNSDLDIAVVVDDVKDINYGDLYFKVSQNIEVVEVDLRVVTKETSPTFIFQVIKTGQCIYQRESKERVRFEAKVLNEYFDTQHLRDIYNSYLKQYFKGG